ncbi:MAG TPA: VanW family protein [Gaiellaceae bacterium]
MAAVVLVVVGVGLGVAFSGSTKTIPQGVSVAGVDVGGLTKGQAETLLQARSAKLLHVPVVFTAGGKSWRVTPDSLGLRVDWAAAVADARARGDGFLPIRGFRRLDVRVFGTDVQPEVSVFNGALALEVKRIAKVVDRPHHEPSIVLHGLKPQLVPGRDGFVLDTKPAAAAIVGALASLERGGPVTLPVRRDTPTLTSELVAPAVLLTNRVLSAPVRLTLGPTRYRLPRWRLAQLLRLPADGRRALAIGGPFAEGWFKRLAKKVDRAPKDADFDVSGSSVHVIPAKPGLALDAPATGKAILRAALRPTGRTAAIAVATAPAKFSTEEAAAMGITSRVSSYTTVFGGDPNRIHNVQLVSHLVDDKLIAPGTVFSFNKTTGERTAAKGFLEAPVIINGELQTGLGGGVCQVSTTVFNAAYEAGLKITERTNHALYISHYPQGRDATVNYPDVDLKFVNDTGHWLLLRTFVSSYELTVGLYGTPVHRRVESTTAPLVVTGQPPVQKTVDSSLPPGTTVVDDYGEPSRSTSVNRKVYAASGKLLYDTTWYSSYRAEPKVVRVGPAKPKVKPKSKAGAGTTTPTTTTGATTTPTKTGTSPTQTTTGPTLPH